MSHDKMDDYFGLCPHCMSYTGMVNAGKTNILYCKEHMVSWIMGAGFGGGGETEEEQRRIYDEARIDETERIEPAFWPKSGRPSVEARCLDGPYLTFVGEPLSGDDDLPF